MYPYPSSAPLNDELEDWEKADLTPRQPAQPPKILARPQAPPAASALDDDADWDRGLSRHAPLTSQGSGSGWDQNKRIWQEANTAPPLMYTQQAFPSLSNASSVPSPPLSRPSSAPSQPKIVLLRRPQSDSSRSGQNSGRSTPPARTLGQREEEYRLARERIFAGSGPEKEGGGNGSGRSSSGGGQSRRSSGMGSGASQREGGENFGDAREYQRGAEQVMRQPLGPPVDGSGGFGPTNRGGFALRGRGNGQY